MKSAIALLALGLTPASAFMPPSIPQITTRSLASTQTIFNLQNSNTNFVPYSTSSTRQTPMMSVMDKTTTDISVDLQRAATEARGLAMDSIAACHSGHMGLPLGCAEIGATLWGKTMNYNPEDPQWLNRDRFILSGGHGSMFIYSWLHLAGYDLPLEEVKNFRRPNSMTPGHPEFPSSHHNTPGIEATTGPLGQGIANAIGVAAAQKWAAKLLNTDEHKIIDQHSFALAGDGCFQEGVSAEAAAFAAHEKLDNVIVIYDANAVTLDKMASFTQSEDVGARFEAYGWEVITIDGHDLEEVETALTKAKNNDNGKPKLIIANTIIGKGIEQVEGTNAAHGEAGVPHVDDAREKLGLPKDEKWYVSPETRSFFEKRKGELKKEYDDWQKKFSAWSEANPEKATLLKKMMNKEVPSADEIFAQIPEFDASKKYATRNAGAEVIQGIAKAIPWYLSGSADLHGSTKNYIKNVGDFGADGVDGKSYDGRNFYYGIREHGMGAIMNGMSYFGLNLVSGATFLVFADYMKATVRVAALSELPTSYIWTHDSIGVGEDGPTHQPVETVTSFRAIPNLDVIRPCDAEETAGAYVSSVTRKDGPTALILSRQDLPVIDAPTDMKRKGVLKGAYTIKKEDGELKNIIIATGSEVSLAIAAANAIPGTRVVSMPCMEIFDRQSQEYKNEVLPPSCTKRMSIEAGVTQMWYKYIGMDGLALGTDEFGMSAPGTFVFEKFGLTESAVTEKAKKFFN